MTRARSRGATAGAAPLFAALGDETRLRLVTRLAGEGPLSIAALTDGAAMTRQAIAKHLRVLEEAGVVRSAREGRASLYRVVPTKLAAARAHLDAISRQWDLAIERLRAHVED